MYYSLNILIPAPPPTDERISLSYCDIYLGRRTSDDERQISRWKGVCSIKGRFRNQLIGKCAKGNTTFDDASISPVIRQSLLHWGYELTEADAEAYVKLKKLPELVKSTNESMDLSKKYLDY